MSDTNPKYQETCLVIVVGWLVLFLIYGFKALLFVAIGVGVIGAFIPALGLLIHRIWFKIAEILGFVMSKVVLGIVFFLVLTPIAFLAKIFRKDDVLQLKRKDDSYWKERNHDYTDKDLKNIW